MGIGTSEFGRSPTFGPFLRLGAKDTTLGAQQFVYRNFLLDGEVPSDRARGYMSGTGVLVPVDHVTWLDWHETYLGRRVFLEGPSSGPPPTFSIGSEYCPETFTSRDTFLPYGIVDEALDLVRVESISSIAAQLGIAPDDVIAEFSAYLSTPPSDRDHDRLQALLDSWQLRLDLRPRFAGFWEDVRELFNPSIGATTAEWPNRLRDCFGLAHYDPALVGPIAIALFRYRVSRVPRVIEYADLTAVTPPTVLDGRFSVAFCPVATSCDYGRAINLSASAEPVREVVHPAFRYLATDLFRVGYVTRPPTLSILDARAAYLVIVRARCRETDFARDTDG